MTTAHEKIRSGRLLPTAPYELLLDTEAGYVVVTWPDLPAELSLVVDRRWSVSAGASEIRLVLLTGICQRADWVQEQLGSPRWREIEAAVNAVLDDQAECADRVAAIYRVLEGDDAH